MGVSVGDELKRIRFGICSFLEVEFIGFVGGYEELRIFRFLEWILERERRVWEKRS